MSCVALGGGEDGVAAAHGQRQRFLAERVEPEIEQIDGDAVVRTGVGGAIGGFQPLGFTGHAGSVGENGRAAAEVLSRPRRRGPGHLLVEVADGDQFDDGWVGPHQFRQPRQVPPSHPTAADDRQPDRFRHASLSPLPLSSPLRLFDGVRIARRWEMSRGWLWV